MPATAKKPSSNKSSKGKKPAEVQEQKAETTAAAVSAETHTPVAVPAHDPELLKLLEEIKKAEADCQIAERQWNGLKEETKEAKENYDAKVNRLRSLAKQTASPGPLFGSANGKPASTSANGKPDEDDAWKDTPISDLCRFMKHGKKLITPALVKKLEDAKLDTLGKLCDHIAKDKWVTDVDGIGKAAADKIDDAIEMFLEERKAKLTAALAPMPAAISHRDWRSAKIADLCDQGFSAADVQPLAELYIHTAGELDDFLQEHTLDEIAGLPVNRQPAVKAALQAWKEDAEDLAAGEELEQELAADGNEDDEGDGE